MHRVRLLGILFLLGVALPHPVNAAIRVFACEPEWASLATELGGDLVSVNSATHARQDPHYIRARPSLIAKVRRADMIFCTGADLEIGWLPLLLQRGAKAGVQPGQPGYLMAADFVPMLEVPDVLDRSQGDIHPAGNPHIHLDPRNILRVAQEATVRLKLLDPANSSEYDRRARDFAQRWENAHQGWREAFTGLKGMPVVVHHRSWSYLIDWIGLKVVATLEPKPGIPPTASHLQTVLTLARDNDVRAILRTPYDPSDASAWLSDKTGIAELVLPFTVQGNAESTDLFRLYESTLNMLLSVKDDR